MTEVIINDSDLKAVEGQVIFITGESTIIQKFEVDPGSQAALPALALPRLCCVPNLAPKLS